MRLFAGDPRSCILLLAMLLLPVLAAGQGYELRGIVTDGATGETLVGASVKLKDGTAGTVTDLDGRFKLKLDQLPPYTLVIAYMGYAPQEIVVQSTDQEIKAKLGADQVLLQEAQVIAQRISDKQKQAPLTVETMDLIAIKEAPSGDFYESLGTLKGVDMTAASFGFKVINTRGFNSTSPVRSLQLIDGVDNQSPGLNFSLGNFLGASDLDVLKVDVIAGASTAFYGPGAFNGVIAMGTKSPWNFRGLSASIKGGERNMLEAAVRYADVFKNKAGQEKWAYKLNVFGLRADDWWAENYDPTSNSPTGRNNPGRYDAVNIYGDEDVGRGNDFTRSISEMYGNPGLGKFLRNGYKESELVDYGTKNFKAGLSVHHRIKDSLEVILSSNYSTGTTVYQGDNRYRLDGVQFFQHKVEVARTGKWFVRGYVTHEDAGKTYDIYTTALRLQDASSPAPIGGQPRWNTEYSTYWSSVIAPLVRSMPEFVTVAEYTAMGWTQQQWIDWYGQFLQDHHAMFVQYHEQALAHLDAMNSVQVRPFYAPGTQRFNDMFNEIKGKRFTEGGSLFFDRSMLAHAMGEYRFKPKFGEVVVGGNFRQYLPNSAGTIFSDTGNVTIRNSEFGVFSGLEKELVPEKLKTTVTLRLDKNQNFDAVISPAASFVYTPRKDRVFRLSFSSAVRNPTLADQYFYYNVGRALLLGNVEGRFEEGRDSLFTIDSFNEYRNTANQVEGVRKLDWFHVDRLRPEQARTIEIGYRGNHFERFYFDVSAYHSWYADFIGYIIGIKGAFDNAGFPASGLQVFRLAANASSQVRTQGANFGVNYYSGRFTYNANYSYNKLTTGANDPIIPAFNTPEHKFNIGLNAHEMRVPFSEKRILGYGVNYKWIQGYTFEGSPQFSGQIPTYDMVDAQVNVKLDKYHLTVKGGVSNLFGLQPLFNDEVPSDEKLDRMFNNNVYLVYGGPRVGRLAYIQLLYEFNQR